MTSPSSSAELACSCSEAAGTSAPSASRRRRRSEASCERIRTAGWTARSVSSTLSRFTAVVTITAVLAVSAFVRGGRPDAGEKSLFVVADGVDRVPRCGRAGDGKMKFAWGDALSSSGGGSDENTGCVGPEGQRYPTHLVDKLVRSMRSSERGRNNRQGRMGKFENVLNPEKTREMLLRFHKQPLTEYDALSATDAARREKRAAAVASKAAAVASKAAPPPGKLSNDVSGHDGDVEPSRAAEDVSDLAGLYRRETTTTGQQPGDQPQHQGGESAHGMPPARLCRSKYNTTAPMFGVSLTSGRTVTIVQKFPDLLQQVVFEVCESKECDVLRGECVQTYVPYLFLVIPLGPVTLTGQDYVLVESGCVCRPKYGVHVPQTLDAYFQPPLPTKAPVNGTNSTSNKSLP